MGLFDKYKEPVFLKESSSTKEELEKLKIIYKNAPEKLKPQISRDIKILNAGVFGEDNIAFELKNSHMPMFIIHDLCLEYEGLKAQIDYLIITRKRNFIVECKNLVGNIEINNNGDFVRCFENGKEEGLYSPITQNQHHMELIKKIQSDRKSNILIKHLFEKYFYENYRSVVVLANPKTILKNTYAKNEVKDQVIRADRLTDFIKRINSERDAASFKEDDTKKLAEYFLSLHTGNYNSISKKYLSDINSTGTKTNEDECVILCPKCGAQMVKRRAKKGQNAGNEFLGCSNYPKCKCIINIKN